MSGSTKGFSAVTNSLGFRALTLHYSADPEKDTTHADPITREKALQWKADAQRAMADDHRWQQEMEINWWTAEGIRVYPEFSEAIHAPLPLLPNPRKVLYRAWDFGWHAPACLIATVDSQDRLLILREVIGNQNSTRDFAQRVLDQCAIWYGLWGPGYQDFCDPAGQQVKSLESEKNERRDIEVLNGLGITPTWEYGWSRKDGRALVHQLLVLRVDHTPSLYVDPFMCPVLMQGFLGKYVYEQIKQGDRVKDEPDESNHPWADAHAALRYLVTGLHSQLGLRRFKYQPVLNTPVEEFHGYGTPVRR